MTKRKDLLIRREIVKFALGMVSDPLTESEMKRYTGGYETGGYGYPNGCWVCECNGEDIKYYRYSLEGCIYACYGLEGPHKAYPCSTYG